MPLGVKTMRSLAKSLPEIIEELSDYASSELKRSQLEALCLVEFGLYLQDQFRPGAAAVEAWTLFSGYPFAAAKMGTLTAVQEHMLRVGRYSLWTLRRPQAWLDALDTYQSMERSLRGYDVVSSDQAAVRRDVTVGDRRWADYDGLLGQAPPLAGKTLAVAKPGPHAFPIGRSTATIELLPTLVAPPVGHDLDLLPAGLGQPLTFTRAELETTAAEMDTVYYMDWVGRLQEIYLSVSTADGFARSDVFTVDQIQHLLGIVGAGKSTLRDILAVHMVKERRLRVTVVVGDVAEILKLVRLYNRYTDRAAAPVLGASGRQRHAQRLHRRLAGQGRHRLLDHDDPGFAYLSTSCVVNALRGGTQDTDVLPYNQAPCTRLLPKSARQKSEEAESGKPRWQKVPVVCPYWSDCPRHHAPRELVRAGIWVASPASLVDSSPSSAQNGLRIRFLELACRRSDLVIVDEADRVQMQFDQMFAPAIPLIGADGDRAFLDDVNEHKIREFTVGGRTQLSDRDVENWSAALNTTTAATDRLYAMLVGDGELRKWVRTGYFSAWTLQSGLLDERYPRPENAMDSDPAEPVRTELSDWLDEFRDNPFGDRRMRRASRDLTKLTALLAELLLTSSPERTRERLYAVMGSMFDLKTVMAAKRKAYLEALHKQELEQKHREQEGRGPKKQKPLQTPDEWQDAFAKRFEFTLLLCALQPKLALMNAMWPRVEAALNLGFNSMYRRPVDYGPMVPEAPMGNVIGFQFIMKGPDRGGVRSGELRFFRCSGVGRELLRAMPTLPTVDGRPGTNVLLMSGSSWAGASTRYHIPVPVGVLIEPSPEKIAHIVDRCDFRTEFLKDGDQFIQVSGAGMEHRIENLCRMAQILGASGEEAEHGGPFERELLELPEKRRRILLLVGSYEEARAVADTLHSLNPRWRDSVVRLVADDDTDDIDLEGDEHHARILRRGDVERLADCGADILVAPLLAVERGHNILNDDDEAAIGTAYFLVRPSPRPDDIALAVHAMNDWIIRAIARGDFDSWVLEGSDLDDGGQRIRAKARSEWFRVLRRSLAWSRLGEDRAQVTWDLLVVIWQVIGRLVRGGVEARVVFVDAAFAPNQATVPAGVDTPESSLLHSILDVLAPYFDVGSDVGPQNRRIAMALYKPLWAAMYRCLHPAEQSV